MRTHEDAETVLANGVGMVLGIILTIIAVTLTGLFRYVGSAYVRHGLHPCLLILAGMTVMALGFGVYFLLSSATVLASWATGAGAASFVLFALTDAVLSLRRIHDSERLLNENLDASLDQAWWR